MGDGDSANNYLQSVMGGGPNPASLAQVGQFSAGADKLLASAKSGGFAINEEGGQAYLNALEDFRQQLTEVQTDLSALVYGPKLGSGAYADEVSQFVTRVFNGDEQALLPIINQLQQQIDKVNEAFNLAKKNYKQGDHESDQRFHSIKFATGA
jgi:hypothetical protein